METLLSLMGLKEKTITGDHGTDWGYVYNDLLLEKKIFLKYCLENPMGEVSLAALHYSDDTCINYHLFAKGEADVVFKIEIINLIDRVYKFIQAADDTNIVTILEQMTYMPMQIKDKSYLKAVKKIEQQELNVINTILLEIRIAAKG